MILKPFVKNILTAMPFYAVARGRAPGVYTTWSECLAQVNKFSESKFKKFETRNEAQEFVRRFHSSSYANKNVSSSAGSNGQKQNNKDSTVTKLQRTQKLMKNEEKLLTAKLHDVDNDKSLTPPKKKRKTKCGSESSETSELIKSAKSGKPEKANKGGKSTAKELSKAVDCVATDENHQPLTHPKKRKRIKSSSESSESSECSKSRESNRSSKSEESIMLDKLDEPKESDYEELLAGIDWTDWDNVEIDADENHQSSLHTTEEKQARFEKSSKSKGSIIPDKVDNPTDETYDKRQGMQFDFTDNGYVKVYTDGACSKNGFKGAMAGVGVWFGDNHPLNVSEPVIGRPTNNKAEIDAVRLAALQAKKVGIKKLQVITDSKFVISCCTQWLYTWKRNGWKTAARNPVKNKEELIELDNVLSSLDITWKHVNGHQGIYGNEMADQLARGGCLRYNSVNKPNLKK